MRVAVIDLGTNTFNLLIAEITEEGIFKKIFSDRIPVKLGEGSINSGYISPAPFQRGIDSLLHYKKLIDKNKVTAVKAFATSAIRSASNGPDFIRLAQEVAGIHVETIDGEREAELIYKGVSTGVELGKTPSLMMDIGGGSTEFIICDGFNVFWKKSFLLGAARLLEKFKPEDPIHIETINQINTYFSESLQELADAVQKYKPVQLIGSSGAFDSFVDLIAAEYNKRGLSDRKTEYNISLHDFSLVAEKVIHSTWQQRLAMKGLIPIRVDMIVISFLFVKYILGTFRMPIFKASTYSLKEGVIAEMLEEVKNKHRK